MERWRLIRHGQARGAWNMGVDEALFEAVRAGASGPLLRLYRWQPATISCGFAQGGDRAVNRALCRQHGIDVVRRSTGGRAVLHDREVTYAVVAPERGPLFPGGVLDNYAVIARPLLAMVRSFGIDAHLVPVRTKPSLSAEFERVCFMAPATHEVVVAGCKIAGSAQKRGGGVFLQHGSIPLELDLVLLHALLGDSAESSSDAGMAVLARAVGWLNRWSTRPLAIPEVEDALIAAFASTLEVSLIPDELTAAEAARARELAATRFADGCQDA